MTSILYTTVCYLSVKSIRSPKGIFQFSSILPHSRDWWAKRISDEKHFALFRLLLVFLMGQFIESVRRNSECSRLSCRSRQSTSLVCVWLSTMMTPASADSKASVLLAFDRFLILEDLTTMLQVYHVISLFLFSYSDSMRGQLFRHKVNCQKQLAQHRLCPFVNFHLSANSEEEANRVYVEEWFHFGFQRLQFLWLVNSENPSKMSQYTICSRSCKCNQGKCYSSCLGCIDLKRQYHQSMDSILRQIFTLERWAGSSASTENCSDCHPSWETVVMCVAPIQLEWNRQRCLKNHVQSVFVSVVSAVRVTSSDTIAAVSRQKRKSFPLEFCHTSRKVWNDSRIEWRLRMANPFPNTVSNWWRGNIEMFIQQRKTTLTQKFNLNVPY
jgi:hypothetical protein